MVVAQAKTAHPEEWVSIVMALAATVGSLAFFWLAPTFQPDSRIAWAIPGWIAGAYLLHADPVPAGVGDAD